MLGDSRNFWQITFLSSQSLNLSSVLQVSAAFLLFPQEIEIDVNSRRRRQAETQLLSLVLTVVKLTDLITNPFSGLSGGGGL